MMSDLLKLPDISARIDELKSIVDPKIEKLEKLMYSIKVPPVPSVQKLIEKLKRIKNCAELTLTSYEIMLLSFQCAAMSSELLSFYIKTFAEKEKDSGLVNGLFYSLIRSWNEIESRRLLISFISNNRSLLNKKLQTNSRFFLNESGPTELGRFAKDISIFDTPKVLCLEENELNAGYFEGVIVQYFREKVINVENLKTATKVLDKCGKSRLTKLLLPDIVVRYDEGIVVKDIKEMLINLCLLKIGQINDFTKWNDLTFAEKEKGALSKCRNIIIKWQKDEAIYSVFGESEYPDRYEYWKHFTPYIDRLKIYSTEDFKPIEKKYLSSYLGQKLGGAKNKALLMKHRDWTVVEFLDGGAVYFYREKRTDPTAMATRVWSGAINRIEDLKQPSLPVVLAKDIELGNLSSYPGDCKIIHNGEWQRHFNQYMRNKNIFEYRELPTKEYGN